jgi:penicillin-binding protein 2
MLPGSHDPLKRRLTRRVFFMGGIQAVAVSVLVGRTAQLQFLQSDQYKTLSEENRIRLQIVTPLRGKLLDRWGDVLAENRVNYRVLIERDNRRQALAGFDELVRLIDLSEAKAASLRKEIEASRYHVPLLIAEHLSWDEVARIQAHTPDLPGVYLEEGQLRYYPLMEKAAHVIGYVGRVTEAEKKSDPDLARLPDFQIGKNGVELLYEKDLRGKAGNKRIEVNALGGHVRELAHTPFTPGEDIRLTIDAQLQAYIAQRLGEESGSVIVCDVRNGNVLACVSMPAFNANKFSRGIPQDEWNRLIAEPRKPLLNKAVAGMYPPASTFKMVVGLACLEAGTANATKSVFCPGHYRLGNQTFKCWKAGGHGWVNLRTALQHSCDTYFYSMARETGIEPIAAMARRFGLGAESGLQLLGEKTGVVPNPQWKRASYDMPWVPGDTINSSIGQGYTLATPAQLAVMTARMVTGRQVSLRLRDTGPVDFAPLDVPSAHLEMVMDGMRMVTMEPGGTAYWTRIMNKGPDFAGKTGTAQVRRLLRRGVNQNTIPWEQRHHALFVGYVPVEQPRYAVSVVIEHGGGGSAAAAPVASDVLKKLLELETQRKGGA